MSNWLGFSFSPHSRIDHEGLGATSREEQNGCGGAFSSLMPLRSDGSLCVVDPFGPRPNNDWRYENSMDATSASHEEGPKLEDFLRCYSNAPSNDDQTVQTHEDHVVSDRINVNAAPSSFSTINGDVDTNPSSSLIQSYHINDYPETLIPTDHTLQHCEPNPSPNGAMHQLVPFENSAASSVSGFKSWLRQTPFAGEKSSNHEANSCNFESLSLAMSPTASHNAMVAISPLQMVDNRKGQVSKSLARESVPRKSTASFGQRTSNYRGVTRHRWTGRHEAHLWDNSCRKEGQTRKGRQVYLGGYDKEEKAARAYDLAALKYWGPTTYINFPLSTYEKELEEMKHVTRQEFVANLRRKSSGFSRGASVYRGVTRHHQHGRWQARIGRVAGNKDLYLGTFSTQEEAAEAYDIAAIKFRGTSAVTNFGISRYDVKRIFSSSSLIAGDLAKRSSKDAAPTSTEDYNSCASTSAQSLLAITNGEALDELTGVVWNGNADEHRQQESGSNTNNDVALVGASSRRNSSNPVSPKSSVSLAGEFGTGSGDYTQSYFSLKGPKHEEVSDESNPGSNNRNNISSLDLVQQVPMFALWNE